MIPGIKHRAKVKRDHIEVVGYYVQTVMVKCFPDEARMGILSNLLSFEFDEVEVDDISVNKTVKITPANFKFNWLTDIKINRLAANIKSSYSGKASDEAREEEEKALDALRYLKKNRGKGKYFDVWLSITIASKSLENLKSYVQSFADYAEGMGFGLYFADKEQHQALTGCWAGKSGFGVNNQFLKKNYGRVMDMASVQAFNPLLDGSISDGPGHAYIGHRYFEQTAVYIDFTDGPQNKNVLIMGDSGAGKTYVICTIAGSLLSCGFKVYIFDINKEYKNFCKAWGGVYIDQTIGSGKYYDPCRIRRSLQSQLDMDSYSESDMQKILDADAARYDESIQATKGMITLLMKRPLTDDEDINLDIAIMKMHKAAGIKQEDMSTWDNYSRDECRIHKLYYHINAIDTGMSKKIYKYFEGTQKSTFAIEDSTEELEDAQLVVISVANTADSQIEQHMGEVKTVMAQNTIWYLVTLERFKKECYTAIVEDEIQRRMRNKHAADEIFKVATNGRRYNTMLIAATNTPKIIFGTEEGEGLWDNTNYKVFLKSTKSTIDFMAEKAGLPDEVVQMWYDLKKYKHAVIFGKMNIIYDMIKSELPPDEEGDYETRGLKKKGDETGA